MSTDPQKPVRFNEEQRTRWRVEREDNLKKLPSKLLLQQHNAKTVNSCADVPCIRQDPNSHGGPQFIFARHTRYWQSALVYLTTVESSFKEWMGEKEEVPLFPKLLAVIADLDVIMQGEEDYDHGQFDAVADVFMRPTHTHLWGPLELATYYLTYGYHEAGIRQLVLDAVVGLDMYLTMALCQYDEGEKNSRFEACHHNQMLTEEGNTKPGSFQKGGWYWMSRLEPERLQEAGIDGRLLY
ncbi:MAG: hypothetical protein Q9194_006464 [Teloschistes cf. exilis]